MPHEVVLERFFETLIAGDRPAARSIVESSLSQVADPRDLIGELFWPAYENIEKLYRSDQLTKLAHHCGTRLLRVLVDQTSAHYHCEPTLGRSVLAFSGPKDSDELGAQMAVDILESAGYTMTFAGGGIPNDEIMARVHETKPDVLLLFASGPSDLPQIRQLIDTIREISACPDLQVVVGGGVFNRAEGLAEEIGADLWSSDPLDLADVMSSEAQRRAADDQRTVGRKRRRKAA
jgi:MerR family transcriptional regulator, light-induced transcriptional regulator